MWGNTVPKRKRKQREHTEDWQTIQQYTLWPEQEAYELLRPLVLFGDPAGKRAQETGAAESTLDRMDGTSRKALTNPRKRCRSKPLSDTSIGRSMSGILNIIIFQM